MATINRIIAASLQGPTLAPLIEAECRPALGSVISFPLVTYCVPLNYKGEVGEGNDESDEGMVGADELEGGGIQEVDPVEEGDLREEEPEYWWKPVLASVGHSWYHFVEVRDPEALLLDMEGQQVVEEYYTHLEGVARHTVAIGVPISQLNLATHLMIEVTKLSWRKAVGADPWATGRSTVGTGGRYGMAGGDSVNLDRERCKGQIRPLGNQKVNYHYDKSG
ncbi:hypothetical protein BV22DRAFT_1052521 [Leucogyrophana mollusca]|uniref:Uncharacterized protein n=1 Tax=Leucogyrophana mollusca TaxID=85980 RepID=A0ACB8AW83_9AGAM|nr:hypothetical protein BV22DRAFT_1052521 [Leucogyrophana mollusca]